MRKMHLFFGLSIFLLFSCSKENPNVKNDLTQTTQNKVLDRIKMLGFKTESIVEYKDYYLVEGDMVFSKSDTATSKLKQARSVNLVDETKRSIAIYLDTNFTIDSLSEALDLAIAAYNNLRATIIFKRVQNQAQTNIIITNYNLVCGFYGRGDVPTSDGRPGDSIRISEKNIKDPDCDPTYFKTITCNQLVFLLVHEMGHTIGLEHTDKNVIHIGGTPSIDSSSVMNSKTFGKPWKGFSYNDSLAIILLYGALPSMSVTETKQGVTGTVYVSQDCSRSGRFYPMGSAPASSIYVTKTVNGMNYGGNIPFKSISNGSFTIKCEGSGAREEYTPWTATYSGIIYKLFYY